MAKTQEVQTQMMAALKAGDKPRKDALSLLLAALKNKQIDKRAPLTEAEEDAVILREIKEAQETIDTTPADRTAVIEECASRYTANLRRCRWMKPRCARSSLRRFWSSASPPRQPPTRAAS